MRFTPETQGWPSGKTETKSKTRPLSFGKKRSLKPHPSRCDLGTRSAGRDLLCPRRPDARPGVCAVSLWSWPGPPRKNRKVAERGHGVRRMDTQNGWRLHRQNPGEKSRRSAWTRDTWSRCRHSILSLQATPDHQKMKLGEEEKNTLYNSTQKPNPKEHFNQRHTRALQQEKPARPWEAPEAPWSVPGPGRPPRRRGCRRPSRPTGLAEC